MLKKVDLDKKLANSDLREIDLSIDNLKQDFFGTFVF
jgi:hypothetical protein